MQNKMSSRSSLTQLSRATLAMNLLAALGLSGVCLPVLATPPPVTNCADSGTGSLRAAVAGAASGDTIDLSNVALTCGTITLTTAAIPIHQNNLVIKGGSGTLFGSTVISGGHSGTAGGYRVFVQSGTGTGTGTLELDNLIITNGKYRGAVAVGGCIYSDGSVTLNNSTVEGCLAYATSGNAGGGGIYAGGTVTLNSSIISDNVAQSSANVYGGGLRAASLITNSSTIHGNRAQVTPGVQGNISTHDLGGAAFLYRGNSDIENSTIDNNFAYGQGGALYIEGAITISNSTISGNASQNGASGIANYRLHSGVASTAISNTTVAFNHTNAYGSAVGVAAQQLTLQSSIVANNSGANGVEYDVLCADCTLAGADNLVVVERGDPPPAGFIAASSDPELAPLSNHGGLTRTHALLATSPAVASGNNLAKISYDQRGVGFSRVTGFGTTIWTDIGAYQRQFADDEIFYQGMEPSAVP